MNKYKKIMVTVAALATMAASSFATPYYTIFHALEEDTMDVFTAGGSGLLMLSTDGGDSYKTISTLTFDHYGRAWARVFPLKYAPDDALVKLQASFYESDRGQPSDTLIHSTVEEFFDSLIPYSRYSWLSYAPVYVEYGSPSNIVEIAVADGRFTTLVAAVEKAGLVETLSGEGPFTVFAPTDAAFSNLLAELEISAGELLNDPGLGDVLLYHVVGAALNGDAVSAETHIETLLKKDVDIEIIGDELFINDSKVILANIEASNGIIHVIDAVLRAPTLPTIPEVAEAAGVFTVLLDALEETGLDAALTNEGPFTVFAPTDTAFSNLLSQFDITAEELLEDEGLADILLYHVVEGRLKAEDVVLKERLTTLLGEKVKVDVTDDGVFINDSLITATDIKAENGIIHIIDAVLIPEEMPNIVEVAEEAGIFTTLIEALQATGLDEALMGDGPFTVFAPTDEAFAELPGWLLNFLVNNPKYLEKVLLYHVVPGDLSAEEVLDDGRLETLQGSSVYARERYGNVYINRSKVIGADIEAENGTVHIIDKVLLPWLSY